MASHTPLGEIETSRRTELITPEPAEALAGLLDIPAPYSANDTLPPLWHLIYLLERRSQSDLGTDGHPINGIPAAPGPGLLRMFAGGRVTTNAPLRFGRPATRSTRVAQTHEKQGRSGLLTFVTVRNEIEQDGQVLIIDEQDIVYRAPGSTLSPSTDSQTDQDSAVPRSTDTTRLEFAINPVLLFRFSALTYNAHRIHYDLPYAAEEGYPGLAVHGPLQALLMGEFLRRSGIPLAGHEFAYRLTAPTFGQQVLTISSDPVDSNTCATVRDGRGTLTATSTLNSPSAH
jgi:3-methylfumaryl-CoA hydratase